MNSPVDPNELRPK